jgi:hypothetical protein
VNSPRVPARLAPLGCGLLVAGLLLSACEEASAKRKKRRAAREGAQEAESPTPGGGTCKAPAPKDARLAEGLELYLAGDWRAAREPLLAWAGAPEADRDPAAGRGYYSLGYALTALRSPQQATAWYDRAEPLLSRAAAEEPTLEDLYYLSSLHRNRQQPGLQLEVVSRALQLLDAGTLCPVPDADDHFRAARLMAFAGRDEERRQHLEKAVELYAAGQGRVTAYHALALHELGEQARRDGDLDAWETRMRRAAELDPTIPGVHRSLGLALLKRGATEEAAEYWRRHWRQERGGGNGLVYAVRILQSHVLYRKRFGDEHRIDNLAEHTKEALEQNAIYEAGRVARLRQELAAEPAEEEATKKRLEHDLAHYRMVQLLTEYVARDQDLQEFALQNGLLPAIHGAGLPRR